MKRGPSRPSTTSNATWPRRTPLAALLSVLAMFAVVVGPPPPPASARTTAPDASDPRASGGSGGTAFTQRHLVNTPGHVSMIGNTVMTCDMGREDDTYCRKGQDAAGNLNNQDHEMEFVDIDGDSSTDNSSSADLVLTSAESVVKAYLYWGGRTEDDDDDDARFDVRFKVGDGAYRTISADTEYRDDGDEDGAYQGVADVTDLVLDTTETYTVGDIVTLEDSGEYGGWAMVVLVANPAEPVRNLVVYDGFAELSSSTTVNIDLDGFQTPADGTVKTKVGYVSWEGDGGLTGDEIWLDKPSGGSAKCNEDLSKNSKYCLTDKPDGVNKPTNNFNSSMTDPAGQVPRNPSYANSFGVDYDQLPADGILANRATSATITLRTSGDQYFPGVVTFSTEMFAPKIDTVHAGVPQAGDLNPGDEIDYSFTMTNSGADDASNVNLSVPVPTKTQYVSSPDGGTLNGSNVEFDVGTIPVGESRTRTLTVAVDSTAVPDGTIIQSNGDVTYDGAETGLQYSGVSNQVTLTVAVPKVDLQVLLSSGTSSVTVPGTSQPAPDAPLTYRFTVSNAGGVTATDAAFTYDAPGGVTPTTTTVSPTGSCTVPGGAGAVVSCDLGGMALGATTDITVNGTMGDTTSTTQTGTATVTSTEPDSNNADNSVPTTTTVNRPPVAIDDGTNTDTNTSKRISVLTNDSDPDGDALTVTATTPAGHGGIVVNLDGTLTYTPNHGYAGLDTFDYTVSDGRGGSAVGTVSVTVNNATPDAVEDSSTATAGVEVTISPLANDTDPNIPGPADPVQALSLDFSAVTQPAHGTVTDSGNGTVRYTSNQDFVGDDTFTYTVSDGTSSDTATVTVSVSNPAPVAADDFATTPYVTDVDIDVLANDSDPNGSTLTPEIVDEPTDAEGSAVVANNMITFTPATGFVGEATFTYRATDAGGASSGPATVRVTVENEGPTAVADTAETDHATAVDIDVLGNDEDPNGDPLTIINETSSEDITVSRVAVCPQAAAGCLRATPDAGFKGVETFTYTIADGRGGEATAVVTVTVNNAAPSAVDDAANAFVNQATEVPVLDNDSDLNTADLLSVVSVSDPPNGTATINSGRVVYTPDTDFVGTDTFTYTVNDSGFEPATSTANVTMTVAPVADDLAVTSAEGTPIITTNLGADSAVNYDALLENLAGDNATDVVAVFRSGPDLTPTAASALTPGQLIVCTVDATPGGDVTCPVGTMDVSQSIEISVEGTVGGSATADQSSTFSVYGGDIDPTYANNERTVTTIVNEPPTAADHQVDFPPLFPPDAASVSINLLQGAIDPDGDPLFVSGTSAPTGGGVVVDDAGMATYTPIPEFSGPDTFTYTIKDGAPGVERGGIDTATVTVDVANAAPTATPDAAAVSPTSGPLVIDVLANDTDPNILDLGTTPLQQLKVASIDDQPTKGSASIAGDGLSVTYTPTGASGTDTFTYTVADYLVAGDTAAGGSSQTTVTITYTNAAPVASDDFATTPFETAISIPVLANDSDDNNQPLSITGLTQPTSGGTVAANGANVDFDPDPGFSGTATFTYAATDLSDTSNSATVTVTVGNGIPTAGDDDADTTHATPVLVDVLVNDNDPNGEPLTIINETSSPNAAVWPNASGTALHVLPRYGFEGPLEFDYTIADPQGAIATAHVTVTVANDPPDANDDLRVVRSATPVRISVLRNDLDANRSNALNPDVLTVAGITNPPVNGTATLLADNVIEYTSNALFEGTDTFEYTVNDGVGGGIDTATVTVQVLPNPDDLAVEDVRGPDLVTVGGQPTVLYWINVADLAGDGTAGTVVTFDTANGLTPQNATWRKSLLGNSGNCTWSETPGGDVTCDLDNMAGGDQARILISAVVEDTASGDQVSTATIAGDDPDRNRDNDEVDFTTGINQPPVADDESVDVNTNVSTPIPVLDGDTDADGDDLYIVRATDPDHGSVIVSPLGLTYTPDPGYTGTDTFDYVLHDGTPGDPRGGRDEGTVTITVLNAAPVAVDDQSTTTANTLVSIPVLANDTDPNTAQTLTISSVDDPEDNATIAINGTSIDYTPDLLFSGVDTFTYTITDNDPTDPRTSTATVRVEVPNLVPLAGNDVATVGFQAEDIPIDVQDNDTDPNDPVSPDLTTSIVTQPAAGGTVTVQQSDGQILFTASPGFSGVSTFTYKVTDAPGGESLPATVTVTVENGPPNADDDTPAQFSPATEQTVDVLFNDEDPNIPADTLTITDETSPETLIVKPAIVNGHDALSITPVAGFKGPETMTYTVSDGHGGTDTATITIDVANAAPDAVDDERLMGINSSEDIPVLANDTDVNGDSLTVTAVTTPPEHGTADVQPGDNTIRYQPATDYVGTDSFSYSVADNDGGTDTATVTITVINQTPAAQDDHTPLYVVAKGQTIEIDALANDSDADPADELVIIDVGPPRDGTARVGANGVVVYNPSDTIGGLEVDAQRAAAVFTDDFSYTVSDGHGGTATAMVHVNMENPAPVAAPDFAEAGYEAPTSIDVIANDSDPNGDDFQIAGIVTALNGSVTVAPDGKSLDYLPVFGFSGQDTITYFVVDARGLGSDPTTVTVQVADPPPVAEDVQEETEPGEAVDIPAPVSDLYNDPIELEVSVQPEHGTAVVEQATLSFLYTPAAGFVGTDTFQYTAIDIVGQEVTADVTVVVAAEATEPTPTPTPTPPPATESPAPPSGGGSGGSGGGGSGSVAGTGSNSAATLWVAGTFLLLGAGLIWAVRRRRS